MSADRIQRDPLTELRFALAESESDTVSSDDFDRVLAAAMAGRPPGYSLDGGNRISGPDTFRRITSRLETLLGQLTPDEWSAPTIRDLDVQQLVGHLIAVEDAFAATMTGSDGASDAADADHVDSTQAAAVAQARRDPSATRQDWVNAVGRTLELAGDGRDLGASVRFHGITFDIDAFLVVRAFELWTHEEDIRRATGRPVIDPDPDILDRMTDLAASMLSAGVSLVSDARDRRARLVLIGPGGGAWDVTFGGAVRRARTGKQFDTHVTVDAAAFCRVVANRSDLAGSRAVLQGDGAVAALLFAGAAALALD